MARENDSAILQAMLKLPDSLQPDFFARHCDDIQDDSTYWNVLGTLWKAHGSVLSQEWWSRLLSSRRKQQQKIMKTRERRAFRKLPKTVTGYRACNDPAEADTAISWTLSEKTAKDVFSHNGKRSIVRRVFQKEQIMAFFDRRGEDEILVLP